MINEPVIVGCGTLGSSLAIYLASKQIVSTLKIYDFDVVSSQTEHSIYPFTKEESGLSKVQITKFICKKLYPNLVIHAHNKKIDKPFDTTEFVIDCRDCKRPNIDARIKLSLDGHLLYIDSCKKQIDGKNYYRYIYPRNPDFIDEAIKIITNYLINDQYIYHDLRLYDVKKSQEYILFEEI